MYYVINCHFVLFLETKSAGQGSKQYKYGLKIWNFLSGIEIHNSAEKKLQISQICSCHPPFKGQTIDNLAT